MHLFLDTKIYLSFYKMAGEDIEELRSLRAQVFRPACSAQHPGHVWPDRGPPTRSGNKRRAGSPTEARTPPADSRTGPLRVLPMTGPWATCYGRIRQDPARMRSSPRPPSGPSPASCRRGDGREAQASPAT